MARIEGEQNGDTGRVREWLARAANAPRDPAWTADGVVSDRLERRIAGDRCARCLPLAGAGGGDRRDGLRCWRQGRGAGGLGAGGGCWSIEQPPSRTAARRRETVRRRSTVCRIARCGERAPPKPSVVTSACRGRDAVRSRSGHRPSWPGRPDGATANGASAAAGRSRGRDLPGAHGIVAAQRRNRRIRRPQPSRVTKPAAPTTFVRASTRRRRSRHAKAVEPRSSCHRGARRPWPGVQRRGWTPTPASCGGQGLRERRARRARQCRVDRRLAAPTRRTERHGPLRRPHPGPAAVRLHHLVPHHLPRLHHRSCQLSRRARRRCGSPPAAACSSPSSTTGRRSSPSASAWASCRASS